jgi:hypothetical protein
MKDQFEFRDMQTLRTAGNYKYLLDVSVFFIYFAPVLMTMQGRRKRLVSSLQAIAGVARVDIQVHRVPRVVRLNFFPLSGRGLTSRSTGIRNAYNLGNIMYLFNWTGPTFTILSHSSGAI